MRGAESNHLSVSTDSKKWAGNYSQENKLKKIPLVTICFWLLIISGYKFYPHAFLQEALQYPLIILLSILLPVSFWLKVQDGKKYQSLIFIAIFLVNCTFLFLALERNFSAQEMLGKNWSKGIYPELAEMLTKAEPLGKRRLAARLIYQRHAVAMPYKSTDTSYILYSPDKTDQDLYRTNFSQNAHVEVAWMNAKEQMLTAFLYLLLHAGLFLALIIFLIVYEQGKPLEIEVQGNK